MSDERLYAYRGIDDKGKSAYGFLLASTQEEAEVRCTAMGVKWEAVYLNGTQPSAQNLEKMKAVSESARKSEATMNQLNSHAQVYQTPAGPVAKAPAPSEARGVPQDLQPFVDQPPVPPEVAQAQGELHLYQPKMGDYKPRQHGAKPAQHAAVPVQAPVATPPLPAPPEAPVAAAKGQIFASPGRGRRESLFFGNHAVIREPIEALLDQARGAIKSVAMINGAQGHVIMTVVVEHDRL